MSMLCLARDEGIALAGWGNYEEGIVLGLARRSSPARKRNKMQPWRKSHMVKQLQLTCPGRISRNSVVCLYKSNHSTVFQRLGVVYHLP